MNYFIITTDAEINIPALSRGLADQFQIVLDSIDISETPPNGRATISVEFGARGDEDTFVSTWIIVNNEGKGLLSGSHRVAEYICKGRE